MFGKKPSPIQTSQQKRGEHHLPEGNKGGAVPSVQWGSENAPTSLPVGKNLAQPEQTSANIRGELSLPES